MHRARILYLSFGIGGFLLLPFIVWLCLDRPGCESIAFLEFPHIVYAWGVALAALGLGQVVQHLQSESGQSSRFAYAMKIFVYTQVAILLIPILGLSAYLPVQIIVMSSVVIESFRGVDSICQLLLSYIVFYVIAPIIVGFIAAWNAAICNMIVGVSCYPMSAIFSLYADVVIRPPRSDF